MNIEKLKSYLNSNNGYITTKELINLGIKKFLIPKLIENKILRKVSYGLYIDYNLMEDEYYILQKRYPSVIFSGNTALYILNLTDRVPYNIDITIPKDKKVRGNYNTHVIASKYYNIGITIVNSPFGNPIKIYNAERSICDMLRYNKELDLEQQNRVLDAYFKSKDKNIDLLLEYAKLFKIYDKVNTILEVMMKW